MSTDADHTFNTLRKWPVEVVRAKWIEWLRSKNWDEFTDEAQIQSMHDTFLAQYGWTWDEFTSACEQSKENPTQCD